MTSCTACWKCCIITCQNGRDTEDTYSFAKCCRISVVEFCKWIPVVLIWCIIGWSYYAYVYLLCLGTVKELQEKVCYLVIYHLLFFMLMWTYIRTIFTDVSRIPEEYYLSDDQVTEMQQEVKWSDRRAMLRNIAEPFNFQTTTKEGDARYCEKCRCMKPDRCHHCSICRTCVLKMDHHCPWTDNCVGFYNYKFFILLVMYGSLYCFFIAGTNARFTVDVLTKEELELDYDYACIVILEFVSFLFATVTLSLLIYHLCLIGRNQTTLETFYHPTFTGGPTSSFSFGRSYNYEQVFGSNPLLWVLPVFSSPGDGVKFPVKDTEYGQSAEVTPE